jgi:ribosomal protein S18 acetylase RimI-like enzyme
MLIRELRRDDREPIQQLLAETNVFSQEEIRIALELVDTVLNSYDQQDYIIQVCSDRNEAVGYYCIGPTPGTQGTFDLYWIAVRSSMHGYGIGSMLIGHAEALIRSRGGRLVIAETSSQPTYEKSREFYLHQGYSELSRIRDYYKIGDDLVVFGKYLTD